MKNKNSDLFTLDKFIEESLYNKKIATLVTTLFSVIFLNTASLAADATVEMLNKQEKEIMVFSQKIVKINVGDKVFWKATNKGHNVEFIKGGVPEGVEKFKSKYSQDVEFKFDTPGIYAYWCTPHKSVGMIGFNVLLGIYGLKIVENR